jgi:hypothetical protein
VIGPPPDPTDYRKASEYDPYHVQRLEERRQAKLTRTKEKLREKSGKGPSRMKALREPHTSIAKVEQDRGRKNSRRKGNRGELDVAEAFSKWCGEHVRRTPGSGGWGGSQDFGTTADLICKKKAFPFHVECKHREGWVLDDLVTGARSDHDKSIVKWWEQCWETCPKIVGKNGYTKLKKEPMLVFRRNRQPWLVMVRELSEHRPALSPPSIFKLANCEADDDNVIVMLLSDFLMLTPVPEGLKNYRRSS